MMNKKIDFQILLTVLFFACSGLVNSQIATLESTLNLVDQGGIKVPYQNGMPLPSFEKQSSRKIIDLAGEWKKLRFSADDNISLAKRDAAGIATLETEAANSFSSTFDDSKWEKKNLPAVENTLKAANNAPEFYNDGIWYRKTFTVDAASTGKFVKLMFYSVNYVCDVWINGKYVGYHEGGYTPFAFDVSLVLNYGANNTIAIRVDNIAWSSRKDIVPYTTPDWFNYAGVIHDVYLEFADPISVVRANIIPKDINGNFQTSIILNNKGTTKSAYAWIKVYEASVTQNNIQSEFVKDLLGTEVILNGTSEQSINLSSNGITVLNLAQKITNPKLWSMKSPNLYIIKITLTKSHDDRTVIDEYYTQFGLRTVSTADGRFKLNDRIWFLTGTARHEEHPDYGRSVPKNIIYSDLVTIKDLNVLYLRTAHYPNHPYTYLIADRLGLAVMEEIPVYWFDTQDAWKIQNEQRKIHQQMFREMVYKDFNRPSVIMWSASNECLDVPNRKIFHQMLKDDQTANYNDGRLLTQSAAADRPGPADDSQNPLDVPGWTMYFGVFHKYNSLTPRLEEAFGGTFSFLNNAKTNFPTKPFIATEFGYWSSENNSSTNEQTTVFNETFKAFKFHAPYNEFGQEQALGNLFGVTWWCVFDWYQYKVNGWQTMGLISMDRKTVKPVANALKSAYLPFFSKEGLAVDIKNEKSSLPREYSLEQNYPNPFNPSTVISYKVQAVSHVTIKVYDLLGRDVATLVDEVQPAGSYAKAFYGTSLPSGIYFYTMNAGNYTSTKKMILMK